MKTVLRRRAGHRWTPLVALAAIGAVALTGTARAEPSTVEPTQPQHLRVMTHNIYLGADLTPARWRPRHPAPRWARSR